MVSKLNKILQLIRDILIILLSFVITTTTPLWKFYVLKQSVEVEAVFYVLIGMLAFISLLSLINILLIILDVQNRGYYYFNTIFQLIPAFLITGLGGGIVVLPFVVLDIIILITLRKTKHPELKKGKHHR